MRNFLFFTCGLIALNLTAQSFGFPKATECIYAVSAANVEQLQNGEIDLNDLSGLSERYPAGMDVAKLPPGHYLTAKLNGEKAGYSYFNTYNYKIDLNAAGGKFQLRLHDPEGKERDDAAVFADGKPVRYSKKHQAYRRRDWQIDGLKIIVNAAVSTGASSISVPQKDGHRTDTLFYRVREEVRRSRFAHSAKEVSIRQPFRTLALPYYWGRSYYMGLKNGVLNGDWWQMRNVPYPLKNTIRRIKNPGPVSGYVSTSQPSYRIGDSLRVSAYLAYPKGRPVGVDSVEMLVQTYGRGARKNFQAKVGGSEKGRYIHVMAVPEDWPLGQDYTVSFKLPGLRWRSVDPSIRFRVEDYELAEYALSTTASDDARLPGSAWLDVKTEDINGLPLPNGNLKLIVHLESIVANHDSNSFVLPDTLYVHTEPTDNRKDRRIILPDSLFPKGHSVRIRVETQLTGPSGEYKEAKNTLTVDRRFPRVLKLEVLGDSLLAFLAPAAAPVSISPVPFPPAAPPPTPSLSGGPRKERGAVPGEAAQRKGPEERVYATLETISPQKDTFLQKITLPQSLKLNHHQAKYRLLYHGQEASQSMTALTPISGSPASWSRDTLRLRLPNPNAQPLRWTLRQNDRIIAGSDASPEGEVTRSGFAPGAELDLHYSYLAGGEWQHRHAATAAPRYDLRTAHKNVLDLELTQPSKVTPGETVRISLQATDQKGRPAANVRLSAGTYNARFDKTPVTTPTYSIRNKRRRKRQNYHQEAFQLSRSEVPPSWLVEDFDLDTALAYQLRYPTGGFTFSRDLDTLLPAKIQQAHFAPFVIKKHQPVTIRTVYADDRLVYWWHPSISTPYSIPIDSGWHEINLRTDDHVYTKTLYFESCRQLVLSFDAERWVTAGWARQQVQKWDDEAVNRIWERVFALSQMTFGEPAFFRSKPNGVLQSTQRSRGYEPTPLGLANNNDQLQFWLPNGDSLSLRFEPKATYRISTERDRLYPLEREWLQKAQARKAGAGPAAPGLPKYFMPLPEKAEKPRYFRFATSLPRMVRMEPAARVQFGELPRELRRIILAPVDKNAYYYARLEGPNKVKPGTYDVLYHFRNDSVFHQQVELGEDSLTLLAFRREDVGHFNNFDRYQGYSVNKPPPEPEVTYEERTYSGNRLSGVIRDPEGETLIGASVLIKGTTRGTVSDIDGNFSLEVPDGDFELVISYTGYATLAEKIYGSAASSNHLDFTLEESLAQLSEVVVTGYGVSEKKTALGYAVTADRISNLPTRNVDAIAAKTAGLSGGLQGRVGGVDIRNDAVEYYVDGVRVGVPGSTNNFTIRGLSDFGLKGPLYIVDGVPIENIDDITAEQIVSINVLKDASITEIYGARGANGVVVISTKSGNLGIVGMVLPPAEIRESFSDYAAYIPDIRTDRQGKAVFDVTFPDDITAWNTFAVGQDRRRRIGFALERTTAFLPLQAQLYLPRFLVADDRSEAATLAINREGGERNVRLSFKAVSPLPRRGLGGEGNGRNVFDTILINALENRYPIEAASGVDSMAYQFTVQATDGDQASDGERRTFPVYPKGTEMVSGELLLLTKGNTALPAAFIRPERGPVTLRLPGNRVQQLLNDLNHIVDYPYACTEQTASRLIGLLQLRAIRAAEGKPFERAANISKMILRLEKLRRPDGGFGWWAASRSSTPWISLHVYRALMMAEAAGQTVNNLTPVRRYLLGRLPELPVRGQLQIMLALGEEGHPPTEAEVSRVDTFSAPNDYELLAVARLHQLRGDTVDVQRLLDSSSTHAALGRYWGRRGYYFYRQPLDGRLACGLLAQRILSAAGNQAEADKTINYLLGQSAARNRPGNVPLLGTNTLESARLLAELLPSLLAEDGALSPPQVTLRNGGDDVRVTAFPYETEVGPNAIEALRLERKGSGPLPVALYQRWFETEPVAKDDGFQLTSRMVDKRGRPLDQLARGETAYLEVTVVSKSDADYVLVEIPIPGGCSYQDRDEARGRWAVHREYRRDRVAIFCDRLPEGKHTYKVALAPRFSGTYTLNPARAEMQYLPVVNGNDGLKVVVVE